MGNTAWSPVISVMGSYWERLRSKAIMLNNVLAVIMCCTCTRETLTPDLYPGYSHYM